MACTRARIGQNWAFGFINIEYLRFISPYYLSGLKLKIFVIILKLFDVVIFRKGITDDTIYHIIKNVNLLRTSPVLEAVQV